MGDSNCNCNCGCQQYSTPPWWVTMGFTPPYNQGAFVPPGHETTTGTPAQVVVPPPPAGTPTHVVQPPQIAVPGIGIFGGKPGAQGGGILGALGQAAGSVVGGATGLIKDGINAVGNVFSHL